MSNNLLTNKFFLKKFSRYLLVGISALVILFTVQLGVLSNTLQRGPQNVYAVDAGYCEDGYRFLGGDAGDNNNWMLDPDCNKGGQQDQNQLQIPPPAQPAPVPPAPQPPTPPAPPTCPADTTTQACLPGTTELCTRNVQHREDCSTYLGGYYACANSAQCGYVVPQPPAPQPPTPQPPQQCPPGTYMGPSGACVTQLLPCPVGTTTMVGNVCHPNITCPTGTTLINGTCQPPVTCPTGTTRDQFGSCIFPQPPSQQCPIGTLRDDLGNCVLPQQQQQQQQQQPAQSVTITTGNVSTGNQTTGNTSTGNQTTGNTTVTTGSVSQTVNVPAQGVPIVIQQPGQTVTREVIRLASAGGNVGVGTSTAQVLGVKELPKTGLPLLAWSVLAFIPTGLRLKKLGTVTKDMEGTPNFIWEDRKFKVGA